MDAPENISFVVDDPAQLKAVTDGKIKLTPPKTKRRIATPQGEQSQDDAPIWELPPIDNAADLIADETVVTPPEIIPGLLHEEMKMSISGASKSQKTWLALHLAIAVATGAEFLGMVAHRTDVLYLNLEIHRGFFRKRIKIVAEKMSVASLVDHLHAWTLRGYVVSFDALLPHLIARAKELKVGLIIIDPIYKLLGGKDENSAGDIGELCNQFDRLAVATNAAVAYVAHYSKGNQAGKSAIDRTSGSGVFARDADTIINLTQHEQPNSLTVEFTLRNHEAINPFVVEWKYPLMVRRNDLNPAQLKTAFSRSKPDVPADVVLAMVPSEEDEPPILQDQLESMIQAQGVGIKRSKDTIKALVEDEVIFKWEVKRSGVRAAIAYHHQPQVDTTPPNQSK